MEKKMVSHPFPDQPKQKISTILVFFILLTLFLVFSALAGEIHTFNITKPDTITAGEKFVLHIQALDETQKEVTSETRELDLKIYSIDGKSLQKVTLTKGRADVEMVFDKKGEALIHVEDPDNYLLRETVPVVIQRPPLTGGEQ